MVAGVCLDVSEEEISAILKLKFKFDLLAY